MDEDDTPVEGPPDSDHLFETDWGGRPPSVAIVKAIAAVEGEQPTAVDFTLSESINPDALNTLLNTQETDEETAAGVVAEFPVKDYDVTLATDGTLTLEASTETE